MEIKLLTRCLALLVVLALNGCGDYVNQNDQSQELYVIPVPTPASFEEVLDYIKSDSPDKRNVGMWALLDYPEQISSALPIIIENLYDENNFELRASTVRFLGEIGPAAQESLPDLIWLAHNEDYVDAHSSLAITFGKLGDVGVIPLLAEYLYTSDTGVAILSAKSIWQLTGVYFTDAERAGATLNDAGEPIIVLEAQKWWEEEGHFIDWENQETQTVELIPEPTKTIIAPTKTSIIPTPTEATLVSSDFLEFSCVEVLDYESHKQDFSGSVYIFTDYEGEILILSTIERSVLSIPPEDTPAYADYFALSPDKRKVLLFSWDSDNIIGHLSSSGGYSTFRIPEAGAEPALAIWVNEDTIAFINREPELEEYGYPVYSEIIYNISTGYHEKFHPSDFSNINNGWGHLTWGYLNDVSFLIDPTLTRAVYPAFGEQDNPLVIWDLENQSEVKQIHNYSFNQESGGATAGAPYWSPDGTMFVTSAPLWFAYDGLSIVFPENFNLLSDYEVSFQNLVSNFPYMGGYELIGVNRDGEIERLSYITNSHQAIQRNFVWSPDGTKIAFLLELPEDENPYTTNQLAVLDLASGVTTSYCIDVDFGEPVWSPDGNQVLVLQKRSGPTSWAFDSIILDLEKEIAIKLEDEMAYGWVFEE